MNKETFTFRSVPGWVYTLVIFGFLYLSGLHTEAIGQVQRALLATGLISPELPPIKEETRPLMANSYSVSESSIANEFLLQDLNGKTIKFSSLQNKVVFMNIWATWCPPCVAEMPGIQQLYDKVKTNKSIAFVMLSVDQNGLEKVKKFVAKKGYTFPVYFPASSVPATFETRSIPTTFILNKQGKIAAQHNGMADYSSPQVQEYLEKLAK